MALIEELRQAVVDGQPKAAVEKTTQGLAEGVPASRLLQDGLIAAMRQVGELYDQGEYYVPEMLVAAHAMKESLAVLKPRPRRRRRPARRRRLRSARSRATSTTSARTSSR